VRITQFLADAVVVCLNADAHHLIANFPPTIETIRRMSFTRSGATVSEHGGRLRVLPMGTALASRGGDLAREVVGNGFPLAEMEKTLELNRRRGCDSVAGLNELVRSGKINRWWRIRWHFTSSRLTRRPGRSWLGWARATPCG